MKPSIRVWFAVARVEKEDDSSTCKCRALQADIRMIVFQLEGRLVLIIKSILG